MKYLIVGTGGTGGAIGGFLAASGKDVSFIARGSHLEAIRQNGLVVDSELRGRLHIENAQAFDMESYEDSPDVIFVCVKGYSMDEVCPFLRRVARPDTMIVPILNVYGTGGKLAVRMPGLTVADGCVYIVSYISAPGEITQKGPLFRVVYGNRDSSCPDIFYDIERDLRESGIDVIVSTNIIRDAFQKFSCVSPMAAAGVFFQNTMGEIRENPRKRAVFASLVGEIGQLAQAMGIPFSTDVVQENLEILDHSAPDSTTSMQRDLQKGGPSEINELLFEVVRLGKRYQVELPTYEMIAKSMGYSEALEPMWLGNLQLRNHLVRSATRDGVENEDGTVSERQLQIMRTFASHEVGMIITGHFYVHPQGQASPSQNGIYDGRFLPGMRRMTDVVHMEEGCIVAQLNHAGGNADVEEPVAPSERVYSRGRLARALTREEMDEIRECFAEGASRAYQAGFDGVQIHMAHDYLLGEFLTPMMNNRTDEYGGSAENRFRFCAEIIEAVRRATSESFPILVKINSNVQANDRQYEEDLLYYLQQMESLGVAAAELSGCDFTKKSANERTYYLERAARMQQQLSMPLILVGGVRSLQDIAKVIDAGIPMVSLSRPLICQGDLIPRLLSGERARCISCNQCFALPRTRGIRCVFHVQQR